jgi:hypothetical protein
MKGDFLKENAVKKIKFIMSSKYNPKNMVRAALFCKGDLEMLEAEGIWILPSTLRVSGLYFQ